LTYDTSNNLTSELFQYWNGNAWVNGDQLTYTYDASNNLASELWQNWNGSTWENYSQYTYTCDANNNRTSKLWQNWNGSTWVNHSLETYTYDDINFRTSFTRKYWNINGTEITDGDSTHYYFQTVAGINDLTVTLECFKVYPNPTSSSITISTPTTPIKNTFMTIIDITGEQLLFRQITEQQTVVDVSGLSQGVYFVKVADDRTVMGAKFIKQ